ncbi:NUDIX hydrolase [Candidatus Dojkabacteria bacterium]|nr:NUDIX hydrolase [Candidatus Dojkabacteria bacterium]
MNRIRINRKKILPKKAKKVFSGVIFDVYHWDQKVFDGSTQTFEMLKRPDTAVVIPTTIDRKILVQYEEQPHKGKFISFPGGRVSDPINIDLEAARELSEETGYSSLKLKLWKEIQPTSKMDYMVYYFIAQGCKKVTNQKLDKGERIEVRPLSLDELIKLFVEDKFRGTEIKVDFLKAYYDKNIHKQLERILFG